MFFSERNDWEGGIACDRSRKIYNRGSLWGCPRKRKKGMGGVNTKNMSKKG